MTTQEFFVKKKLKLVLLRFSLVCAVAAVLIPLVVRYTAHEDLTAQTFFRLLFISVFSATILTVIHLVSWWIDARATKAKSRLPKS
jgi:hypothetical protein